MHSDDPWPRPRNREINPLWIAAGIVATLYLGYQIALYSQDKRPTGNTRQLPAPAEKTARTAPPPAPLPVQPPAPAPLPAPVVRYEEPVAQTREIYLCKDYGGGMFWSSAICSTQRATIDRIVTVPASLPWDQQVQLAEGRRQEAQALYAVPQQAAVVGPGNASPGAGRPAECDALEMRIQQLDAMSRQPQSGHTQDWIRSERQAARSRQAALRC